MTIDIRCYGQSAFKIRPLSAKAILIDPFITKNPKTLIRLKEPWKQKGRCIFWYATALFSMG
jgi:L-ascorbate metabolism protein UlaG (beta-lactamase superfamily)